MLCVAMESDTMLYLDVTHRYTRGIHEQVLEEVSDAAYRTKYTYRSGDFETTQGSPSRQLGNYAPTLCSLAE